jgi:hypothetical protein
MLKAGKITERLSYFRIASICRFHISPLQADYWHNHFKNNADYLTKIIIHMKNILAIVLAAVTFTACNNDTHETSTADSTVATTTTTEVTPPTTVTTTTTTRTATEGDVVYDNGRVQVYRSSAWADADDDVKFDNGIVVYRDGRAVRNGTEVELEEGYVVDRDGNVWDRTGNAVSDAWDATKHGVKKAGKAVGHAAKKVGEKAKDAVD